jgi:hypothetical protein
MVPMICTAGVRAGVCEYWRSLSFVVVCLGMASIEN